MNFGEIQLIKFLVSGREIWDIISHTMILCFSSSIISLLLGLIIGLLISFYEFKGKKVIIILIRTLTAIPPVVCGLICYILFSGAGPLGFMKLLFTIPGMIIAQVLLITPVVASSIEAYLKSVIPRLKETCEGLKIRKSKAFLLTLNESKYQILFSYLIAFSRSIAEVGAVSMVGGAIAWKTNVMTTAIMQYTNMGDFKSAFILGGILIGLALVITIIVTIFQMRITKNERN